MDKVNAHLNMHLNHQYSIMQTYYMKFFNCSVQSLQLLLSVYAFVIVMF